MIGKILKKATAAGLLLSPIFAPSAIAFENTDEGKVIVFGGRHSVPVLDPHVRYDAVTRTVQQAVYDALLKYEGDPAVLKPWLAERWESSPDGRVWTFHLVQNATFHNGDPVTAEAVRYSFERGLKLNKGVSWMLKDFLAPDGITVVDDHTVKFELKSPYAPFLSFLPWWFIINPIEVKANEVDGDYGQNWLRDHVAGSGPFKLDRWEPNVLYQLDTVEDYWQGWPQGANRPAGIIYKIIREPAAQKAALLRGEADIVEGLTADDYLLVKRNPGVAIEDHKGMTTFGIKFNTQKGPTADVNLRKAIAFAMDYDALIQIYNGAATLQTSPFPDAMKGHIEVPNIPRRDITKAREYLAKSAYPDGGITLQYAHIAGHEETRRIGLILLDSLKPLNIDVELKPDQWPNLVANGSNVETSPAMTAIFNTPISTDPDAIAYQYHKASWGQYYGLMFYDNPRITQMIDEARSSIDWDERSEIYADLQKQIVSDQPEVFGMLQNRRWARRDHLKGFSFSPIRMNGEVDFYPLWIDAE